jgi:Tfp pilus assembly protein PilV
MKDNKGQSLVELIVSIAIIQIGLFSVWSLFLVNFNAEREAEMKIVGVNLAREGMRRLRISVTTGKRSANTLNSNDEIWPWDSTAPANIRLILTAPASVSEYHRLYKVPTVLFCCESPSVAENHLARCCCASADSIRCDNESHYVATPGGCVLKSASVVAKLIGRSAAVTAALWKTIFMIGIKNNLTGFTLPEMLVTVGVLLTMMVLSAVFINVNNLQQQTANLAELRTKPLPDGKDRQEIRGRKSITPLPAWDWTACRRD